MSKKKIALIVVALVLLALLLMKFMGHSKATSQNAPEKTEESQNSVCVDTNSK